MNARTPGRFTYATRPVVPGCYHVWSRPPLVRYLGRVYRTAQHKWMAGEADPHEYLSRESAARALAERVPGVTP